MVPAAAARKLETQARPAVGNLQSGSACGQKFEGADPGFPGNGSGVGPRHFPVLPAVLCLRLAGQVDGLLVAIDGDDLRSDYSASNAGVPGVVQRGCSDRPARDHARVGGGGGEFRVRGVGAQFRYNHYWRPVLRAPRPYLGQKPGGTRRGSLARPA